MVFVARSLERYDADRLYISTSSTSLHIVEYWMCILEFIKLNDAMNRKESENWMAWIEKEENVAKELESNRKSAELRKLS